MTTYTTDDKQARRWLPVNVSSADAVFGDAPKAIFIGVGGTIVLTGSDGIDASFAVSDREILPMMPAKIKSAGTTATGIVALY